MEFHELSDLMPFREEQVDAIEMRMRKIGWKSGSVITTFEGKILDGRHRYKAAERVGIEPVYVEYVGEADLKTVANFVVLENCESRHLSLDEKYQLLCNMRKKDYWPKRHPGKNQSNTTTRVASPEIAKILGVHTATVNRWDNVGRKDYVTINERNKVRETATPEVVDAMERGDITTKDAVALAELPLDEQVNALKSPKSVRANTSGNDEWYTPAQYIELAREVMGGIDVDPAGCEISQEVIQAPIVYTIDDSGLDHSWIGKVWLNPPYSKGLIDQFVAKLREEYASGNVEQAIVLTHNFTDTAWFHALAADAAVMCFTRGRIKFYTVDGVGNSPTSGHVFFYFGKDINAFIEEFTSVGFICVPR